MASERSGTDEIPTNRDGFRTSRARYDFNIDRLEKKYSGPAGQSEVVIKSLKTFDMEGTEKEVKKEFKRLAEIGEKFSFATMSSPVVDAAELESTQLAAKCLVLNDIFRSKHQGSLGLPAPPPRLQITGPSGVTQGGTMTRTRSRSKAMIEEQSTAVKGGGGDGTPVRPIEGRGARKGAGGGMAVAARAGRTVAVASGRQRGAAMMLEDEGAPAESGIVGRTQTAMGAVMAEEGGEGGTASPAKRARRTGGAMEDDDAGSGYGGGGGRGGPAQTTPPNLVAIEQPVSSRTRQRTRLSLVATTPTAAIAAAPAAATTPATPAARKTGRRVAMPTVKWTPEAEEKGGKKTSQTRGKKEEEKKERKRSADDTNNEVTTKQARVTTPKASAAVVRVKKEETEESKGKQPANGRKKAVEGKKTADSSIQVVGQVYRDPASGRELVCEPESPARKKIRIDSWIEESFNRTISDCGSQDDSAGPSTSLDASEWEGDFEKDKDVESFDKNLRKSIATARNRNSNMKMGIVDYSSQRRSTSTQGSLPKNK